MKTAVIALITGNTSLGQSIGCLAPLKKEMRLGRLVRVCNRMADGRPRGRVSVNILGAHSDIPGSCISISLRAVAESDPNRGLISASRRDS